MFCKVIRWWKAPACLVVMAVCVAETLSPSLGVGLSSRSYVVVDVFCFSRLCFLLRVARVVLSDYLRLLA